MATVEPDQALIKEIQDAFEADAAFAGVRVVAGWPGDVQLGTAGGAEGTDDDQLVLPAVGIEIVSETEAKARTPEYRCDDLGATERQLYAMADVTYAVTIEVWAATKTERGALVGAVVSQLDGPVPADLGIAEPRPHGLQMTLSRYHDVFTRLRMTAKNKRDAGAAREGYFRTIITCVAVVPRVRVTEYNKASIVNTIEVDTDLEV